jgi:hypothetical protein
LLHVGGPEVGTGGKGAVAFFAFLDFATDHECL